MRVGFVETRRGRREGEREGWLRRSDGEGGLVLMMRGGGGG